MKNYEVLKEFYVEEYKSNVVKMRNVKNGLEVVHFKNSDKENLFAFAFRTPNNKGNGAAHIIEHSVLCGSEIYPLKDPFIVLSNQSVNTFLNAMTYPDRTVYPAASTVKADYFNLLSVYADAVFFPKLQKEIFLQEGHRVEFDEDGIPSIQGVVYNEMKGEYSDFDAIVDDVANKSLLSGSIYEKDSGGDPLEIPSLTYEEFVAFHKEHYRTENCLLFLWGDIETTEILEFLDDRIFSRLAELSTSGTRSFERQVETPDFTVDGHFGPFESLRDLSDRQCKYTYDAAPLTALKKVEALAPGSDDGKCTALLNFNFGKASDDFSRSELFFLARLLNHHSGSPLKKALVESGLGEDLSPASGLSHLTYNYIYSIGLRGVKNGDEEKVKDLIFNVLDDLSENGFEKDDIEACLLSCEYKIRNISRGQGPFSLSMMNYAVYGWCYGYGAENTIARRSSFKKIEENIKNDENYLKNMIKKLFLENKNASFTVIRPSENFMERRNNLEAEILKSALEKQSEKEIKKENKALLKFQQKSDDASFIPHLSPSDFLKDENALNDTIKTEISYPKPDIPFIKNIEDTNGIVFFSVGFPVDRLTANEYKMLSVILEIVTGSGFGGKDWAEAAQYANLSTQGITGLLMNEAPSPTPDGLSNKEKNPLLVGRQWLIFKISACEEKIEEMLSIISSCIKTGDYFDFKHNKNILNELKNDLEGSIIPYGHYYATMRAQRKANRNKAISEILNGLTLYFTVLDALKMADEDFSACVSSIMEKIKSSGSFIHVIAEKENAEKIEKMMPDFIEKTELSELKAANEIKDEEFFALTELSGTENPSSKSNIEYFETQANVGFCATYAKGIDLSNPESASNSVLAHWLSSNVLWEQIRTVGGAYGAFCRYQNVTGITGFSTYRDPSPEKSLSSLGKCLKIAGRSKFTDEDCQKAVIGCFSDLIQPLSPSDRGGSGLMRLLYGRSDEDRRNEKIKILNVKAKDVKNALKNLEKSLKENDFGVIIGPKNSDNKYRKIIELPL